ncbi:MAG: hypothetical protein PVJ16_02330, partial [Nitrosopumilaceae archaeon]
MISSKLLECVDAATQFHVLNKIKNKFDLQLFGGGVEEFYFMNEHHYKFKIYFLEIENIFFIFAIKNIIPKYFEKSFQPPNDCCTLDIVLLDNTTTNITYPHASLVVLLDNTTTNITYPHASLVVLLDNTTTNITYPHASLVVLLDNTTTNITYPHASLVVLLDNTTTNITYPHASLVVLLDNT